MKILSVVLVVLIWLSFNLYWISRYGWPSMRDDYLFRDRWQMSAFLYGYLAWIIFLIVINLK